MSWTCYAAMSLKLQFRYVKYFEKTRVPCFYLTDAECPIIVLVFDFICAIFSTTTRPPELMQRPSVFMSAGEGLRRARLGYLACPGCRNRFTVAASGHLVGRQSESSVSGSVKLSTWETSPHHERVLS